MQRTAFIPPPRPYTDDDLIDEYVGQAELSPATLHSYRAHQRNFAGWLAAHGTSLRTATAGDVHRFMSYLRSPDRALQYQRTRGDELSPATRKIALASLRALYRYLFIVELVTSDPTAMIRAPRVTQTPGIYLTPEELNQLLNAPGSARERIQTYLLAYTAARSGELRSLRWSDVDFDNAVLRIHGKGSKVRFVDIHPKLIVELRHWWIHQLSEAERTPALRDARHDPNTDFVLLTRTGRQLSDTAIYKQLKRRACAAGLHVQDSAHREHRSLVSPHALRRTFATYLLNEGHPIDAVADVLGHDSTDTTRRHYAFSSSDRRRSTIRGFNP